MTPETALKAHAQPAESHDDERATAALEPATDELILDSFPLLDHRARTRATSKRRATPGPHLAFGEGHDMRLIPLRAKITHIGRGTGSDLRFEEHRVSRRHAILVRHGRYTRVLDNRSANGTYINGRRIIATNISDGDVIRLGAVAMQYVEIQR